MSGRSEETRTVLCGSLWATEMVVCASRCRPSVNGCWPAHSLIRLKLLKCQDHHDSLLRYQMPHRVSARASATGLCLMAIDYGYLDGLKEGDAEGSN